MDSASMADSKDGACTWFRRDARDGWCKMEIWRAGLGEGKSGHVQSVDNSLILMVCVSRVEFFLERFSWPREGCLYNHVS